MRLLSAVIKIVHVYPRVSPVGLYLWHYPPPSTTKYRWQFDGNAERFHFYAAGWNRVQWLRRRGWGRKGEGGRGVFRGVPRDWLRADELGASFSRVNSRVSRKMRRGRDGKHDGERGGAFIASTYEPTFRGRYVARSGFPDLFHNRVALSLSLFFFFHSTTIVHLHLGERPRHFPSSTASYRWWWIRQPDFCSLLSLEGACRYMR